MLIAGRIISGICNGLLLRIDRIQLMGILTASETGLTTSVSPVYHAETSRPQSRGRALISELFILDVGWLVAQFVTFGFSFTKGAIQWISINLLDLDPIWRRKQQLTNDHSVS